MYGFGVFNPFGVVFIALIFNAIIIRPFQGRLKATLTNLKILKN